MEVEHKKEKSVQFKIFKTALPVRAQIVRYFGSTKRIVVETCTMSQQSACLCCLTS